MKFKNKGYAYGAFKHKSSLKQARFALRVWNFIAFGNIQFPKES